MLGWKSLSALGRARPACSTRRRSFAATASASVSVYISRSHSPWLNLAYEDWLFRRTEPKEILLFLYRNSPCVVIGRNQNPWSELNFKRMAELDLPFVRRKSGGGTVYHDLGNLNFCVVVPRLQFERRTNAEMVTAALKQLDIPAYVNDRNDICVDNFKMRSAFKLVNARAYHHGTLLVDAELADLRGALGNKTANIQTKGVASVPSPVRNLTEWSGGLTTETLERAIVASFRDVYGKPSEINYVYGEEMELNLEVSDTAEELQSAEWMYSQTPEFTHTFEGTLSWGRLECVINSKHGQIVDVALRSAASDPAINMAVSQISQSLKGDSYGFFTATDDKLSAAASTDQSWVEHAAEILAWLKSECFTQQR